MSLKADIDTLIVNTMHLVTTSERDEFRAFVRNRCECEDINDRSIGEWVSYWRNYDPAPYCSYGHRDAASCDCGPIAANE